LYGNNEELLPLGEAILHETSVNGYDRIRKKPKQSNSTILPSKYKLDIQLPILKKTLCNYML
jgi:hypothetical protein